MTEPTTDEKIAALTARVEALETRRTATSTAKHWVISDARQLARRGLVIEGGKISKVNECHRATWIDLCERALSRSVDALNDAAMADGMGVDIA